MPSRDEYLLLSQLAQAGYCLRRAALIMNEQLWQESADTAKGRAEHARVHDQRTERRTDEIRLYEQDVWSDTLRIVGKCDLVEVKKSGSGSVLPIAPFPAVLYPVEFKHGNVRNEPEYMIQLCAQALCLEEMFGVDIREGALFFVTAHRRMAVRLDDSLRQQTLALIAKLREIKEGFFLPPAEYGPKCRACSLKVDCEPRLKRSAAAYCSQLRQQAEEVPTIEETA